MFSTGELYVYGGTFLVLLATGLGFPLPEEIPIVTAGVLASKNPEAKPPRPAEVVALLAWDTGAGCPAAAPWAALQQKHVQHDKAIHVRWWLLLPICIFGVVLGDAFLYTLGRLCGPRLLDLPLMARLVPADKRQRIESNFHHYGIKMLFARLLPGIRSPIFIIAGIMRLPLKRFLLADGLYAVPGVSLLFFLAYWFTNSFKELVEHAAEQVVLLRHLLIVVAIVAATCYFVVQFMRRPVPTGDPHELPLIGDQVAASIEPSTNGTADKSETKDEQASSCLGEPETQTS